jgi:branched-chain amino acid transport system ATP-binding protein
VQRGHIHALIGPNGAGKTTCFNLLTKFLVPTSGQILFNGATSRAPGRPRSPAWASSAPSRFRPCSRT